MTTLIQPIQLTRPATAVPAAQHRTPHCDRVEKPDRFEAVVFLPGTQARGIELLVWGRQVIITARRERPVRANWLPLHLERSQRDYRLRLNLGRDVDPSRLRAAFSNGILHLRAPRAAAARARDRAA